MRQLLPEVVEDVDPVDLYARDLRPAPAGRPWVVVSMIASADGGTSVGGVSGPLGGQADKQVFGAVRAVADAVLVGAATVRAERYGPARPAGGRPPPRVAVVTASGDLDPALRLFADAPPSEPPPVVLTCAACPPRRRSVLEAVAEVVLAGDTRVDLPLALAALAERGAGVVVAEGGPSLNGQLVAADLADEWCLSLAPWLLGGRSPRPAAGDPGTTPRRLRLDRLLVEDDLVFARYVRDRVSDASPAP